MEKNKGGWKSCGDTMSPQDEAPRLKDLGIENHSSHDERSVLKLKDLGIEERMVARWNHFTKAGVPTESTSNTM